MKFSLGVLSILLATVAAQTEQVCTQELVKDVDCADVINPTACYNMFRFRNAQTLSCIEGTDNADRARKVSLSVWRLNVTNHCPCNLVNREKTKNVGLQVLQLYRNADVHLGTAEQPLHRIVG